MLPTPREYKLYTADCPQMCVCPWGGILCSTVFLSEEQSFLKYNRKWQGFKNLATDQLNWKTPTTFDCWCWKTRNSKLKVKFFYFCFLFFNYRKNRTLPRHDFNLEAFQISLSTALIRCQISKLCSGFLYPSGKCLSSSLKLAQRSNFWIKSWFLPHHSFHLRRPISG